MGKILLLFFPVRMCNTILFQPLTLDSFLYSAVQCMAPSFHRIVQQGMYFHKQFPVLTSDRNDVRVCFFLQSLTLLPLFTTHCFCWTLLSYGLSYEATRQIFDY